MNLPPRTTPICVEVSRKARAWFNNPRVTAVLTSLLTMLVASASGIAAEAAAEATPKGPAGTWKWGWSTPAGQTVDVTLRMRQDGKELSGYILGRNNAELQLRKIELRNDEIEFEVNRDKEGNRSPARYRGRLEGNKIIGMMEFERDGEKRMREWEATRQPEQNRTRRPGISGIWRYKVKPNDGDPIDLNVRLRFENGKLTGSNRLFDSDVPILDGSFKDGEVRFKVVREWDGRSYTSTYVGKIMGEKIKGEIETDFTGKPTKLPWEAWKD